MAIWVKCFGIHHKYRKSKGINLTFALTASHKHIHIYTKSKIVYKYPVFLTLLILYLPTKEYYYEVYRFLISLAKTTAAD